MDRWQSRPSCLDAQCCMSGRRLESILCGVHTSVISHDIYNASNTADFRVLRVKLASQHLDPRQWAKKGIVCFQARG